MRKLEVIIVKNKRKTCDWFGNYKDLRLYSSYSLISSLLGKPISIFAPFTMKLNYWELLFDMNILLWLAASFSWAAIL